MPAGCRKVSGYPQKYMGRTCCRVSATALPSRPGMSVLLLQHRTCSQGFPCRPRGTRKGRTGHSRISCVRRVCWNSRRRLSVCLSRSDPNILPDYAPGELFLLLSCVLRLWRQRAGWDDTVCVPVRPRPSFCLPPRHPRGCGGPCRPCRRRPLPSGLYPLFCACCCS